MSELTVSAAGAVERTPQKIGEEIRSLTYQAKCMTVYYGVEIGRRLVEAKKMVGHGGWGEWVKNETEFSQSTATRFMKVFEEYGAEQIGIFGAVENSSTLQNISISNALRLLAVPKEEREDFAAEVDAENISARELERVIQERDEARKQREDMKKEMDDQLEEQRRVYDVDMAEAKGKLEEAEEKTAAIKRELEELRKKPVEVAVQVDEEAVNKAAKDAEKRAKKEWSAKVKAAEEALAKAEEEKKQLAEQVEELKNAAENTLIKTEDTVRLVGEVEMLKKQLAMSGAETLKFRMKFETWQVAFADMKTALKALDAEIGEKMKAAVRAQLTAWSSEEE